MKGTPLFAGFYSTNQRPVEEAYLNDGTPWENEAAVLAGIPSGARYVGQFVNIANDLYWFLEDLTTLKSVKESLKPKADEIEIDDEAGNFAAENVEDALKELIELYFKMKNPFLITLSASGSVSGKIAGAVFPPGWTLTDVDGTDLKITHTLIGREVANVIVKEVNGTAKRFCVPFSEAFAGITEDGFDITIEGINQTDLALQIFIFFSNGDN